MKRLSLAGFLLILAMGVAAGCARNSDERVERVPEESRDGRDNTGVRDTENLGEAMEGLGRALGDLGESIGGDAAITPVDFRDLRELIPERVRGMEQTANSGERAGALGISISKVERTFSSNDSTQQIDLTVIDLGSLRNAAMLGFNWLKLDVDREDDRGFERTREYKGHPAYEKCERVGSTDHCSFHVVVAERFIVQLESRGVTVDKLHDVVDDIDLKKLDKMRYEGVKDVE